MLCFEYFKARTNCPGLVEVAVSHTALRFAYEQNLGNNFASSSNPGVQQYI